MMAAYVPRQQQHQQHQHQPWTSPATPPPSSPTSPSLLAGSAHRAHPETASLSASRRDGQSRQQHDPETTTQRKDDSDSRSGEIGRNDRLATTITKTMTTAEASMAEAASTLRPQNDLPLPHGVDAGAPARNVAAAADDIGQVDHASSHPIAVPHLPASTMGFDQDMTSLDMAQDTSLSYIEPSLEEFIKNRRPSISFHPTVTLESGHQHGLNEPLPKLTINTKARRESLLSEARQPARYSFQRAQSESDCQNYDPTTGEHFDQPSHRDSESPPLNASHHQVTSNGDHGEAPPQRTSSESEQGVSLTSDSTTSPLTSEIQTPTENMEILMSPASIFPPLSFPVSLEDSSAWPKPRRQTSGARAKSYEVDRGFSMRSIQRQNSRASTRRSTSSSMSPATAFLSRFARTEAPPEPDGEGQEVGEYVLGRQVGYGGFSSVKEAFTIEGDERICRAVKVVRRQIPGKEETENDRLQAEFEHEVSLWRCLGHRNILPLIEVYETDFATFCFTKLNTGGTLFDVVRANRGGLGRDRARRYAYQLASAIRYLHEDVRIVHRDIKLENCLIDVSDPAAARDGGNVLLCDFGLAECITNDPVRGPPADPYAGASNPANSIDSLPPLAPSTSVSSGSETSTSIAGSLQYASPELILSPAGFLSTVVDVWAFGVVLYAILAGTLPFQHTFQPRVQMMILAGEWSTETLEKAPGVRDGYEDEVLELVRGCLDMCSESRWTIGQVLASRWLQGCQEILEELNESFKL